MEENTSHRNLYPRVNRISAAFAIMMFAVTILIGLISQVRLISVFIRAFGIFVLFRVIGSILAYLLFYEPVVNDDDEG